MEVMLKRPCESIMLNDLQRHLRLPQPQQPLRKWKSSEVVSIPNQQRRVGDGFERENSPRLSARQCSPRANDNVLQMRKDEVHGKGKAEDTLRGFEGCIEGTKQDPGKLQLSSELERGDVIEVDNEYILNKESLGEDL